MRFMLPLSSLAIVFAGSLTAEACVLAGKSFQSTGHDGTVYTYSFGGDMKAVKVQAGSDSPKALALKAMKKDQVSYNSAGTKVVFSCKNAGSAKVSNKFVKNKKVALRPVK